MNPFNTTSAFAADRRHGSAQACRVTVTLPVRGIIVDRAELARWSAAGYAVSWIMPGGTPMVDYPVMDHYVFGRTPATVCVPPFTPPPPMWPPAPHFDPRAFAVAIPPRPLPSPPSARPAPPPSCPHTPQPTSEPRSSPSFGSRSGMTPSPPPLCIAVDGDLGAGIEPPAGVESPKGVKSKQGAELEDLIQLVEDVNLEDIELEKNIELEEAIESEEDIDSETIGPDEDIESDTNFKLEETDEDASDVYVVSADTYDDRTERHNSEEKEEKAEDKVEEQLSGYDEYIPSTPPQRTWSAGPAAAREVAMEPCRRWSAPRLPAFAVGGSSCGSSDDDIVVMFDDDDDLVPLPPPPTPKSPVEGDLDEVHEQDLDAHLAAEEAEEYEDVGYEESGEDEDEAGEMGGKAYSGYYGVLGAEEPKVKEGADKQESSQHTMSEEDDEQMKVEQEEQHGRGFELGKHVKDKKRVGRKPKLKLQEATQKNKGGYSHTWSSLAPDSRTFALPRASDVLKQHEETSRPPPHASSGHSVDTNSSDSDSDIHVFGIDGEKIVDLSGMPKEFSLAELVWRKRILEAKADNKDAQDLVKTKRANKQDAAEKSSRTQKRARKRKEKKAEKKADAKGVGEASSNAAPSNEMTRPTPEEPTQERQQKPRVHRQAQPAQRVGGRRMNNKRSRPQPKPHEEKDHGDRERQPDELSELREVTHGLIADGIRNASAENGVPLVNSRSYFAADRLGDPEGAGCIPDPEDEADPVGGRYRDDEEQSVFDEARRRA
ncbi:uncharacterized protein BKCO1_5800062 [Diplodia corticola]|uniref:Uncharacterized protein n=1 Tax=Diplodia corticola TaxID=236234 RepID=A0A1J9RSR3_9PEZI|nr:uncharacterized protein BKCO1_5800062 [Diplodia corticola]OJD30581.1 hypothetical protein BKCO1_5800062 [Diplodia corticola]